jgi:hypothetical protein
LCAFYGGCVKLLNAATGSVEHSMGAWGDDEIDRHDEDFDMEDELYVECCAFSPDSSFFLLVATTGLW